MAQVRAALPYINSELHTNVKAVAISVSDDAFVISIGKNDGAIHAVTAQVHDGRIVVLQNATYTQEEVDELVQLAEEVM